MFKFHLCHTSYLPEIVLLFPTMLNLYFIDCSGHHCPKNLYKNIFRIIMYYLLGLPENAFFYFVVFHFILLSLNLGFIFVIFMYLAFNFIKTRGDKGRLNEWIAQQTIAIYKLKCTCSKFSVPTKFLVKLLCFVPSLNWKCQTKR